VSKQISKTGRKALTIRLPEEDHALLLKLTAKTGISINSLVRQTIQAAYELASDQTPTPCLPQFFATLRISMNHKPGDHRFRASE